MALAMACRSYDGARRIGKHTSTANVARDMDVIRTSMGDESLNFLGLSYGTYVAATYANLFPENVRSVVADGVLDPVAWVNKGSAVPFSTRLRSDEGAAETLEEFFTQCEAAAPGNCAFAPDSSARFDALARSGPVLRGRGPTPGRTVQQLVEGFPSVARVDTSNPRPYGVFSKAARAAEAEFGYFGPLRTWASSPVPAGRSATVTAMSARSRPIPQTRSPSTAVAVDGLNCPSEYNAFDVIAGPPAAAAASKSTPVSGPTIADMMEILSTVLPEVGLVPPGHGR